MRHIVVFRKALAFMLRNGLLATHNPGVKYLLEVLKLLYKVSAACFYYNLQTEANLVASVAQLLRPTFETKGNHLSLE